MSFSILNIDDLDFNKSYTFADYLTWNFQDRIELIKGKIFKMSPFPNRNHQTISGNLFFEIKKIFINKSCKIYSAPFDVRLIDFKKSNEDQQVTTVIQPDICIICDQSKLDNKGCIGAPDLIIEILSPGNTEKEMSIKFDLYEENNVKEYWIVEPFDKTIFIYTLQNGKYIGLKPQTYSDTISSPLFKEMNFEIKKAFED